MKFKKLQSTFILIVFLLVFSQNFAQSQKTILVDSVIKYKIYNQHKNKIVNYSKSDFDKLFFEFFQKQGKPDLILSQDEYYNYTIKIAIYSDRLGLLYKDQKASAEKSKKEWFAKNYQDYLNAKPKTKKL